MGVVKIGTPTVDVGGKDGLTVPTSDRPQFYTLGHLRRGNDQKIASAYAHYDHTARWDHLLCFEQ